MSEQETARWLQRETLKWMLPRVKQGARLAGQAEQFLLDILKQLPGWRIGEAWLVPDFLRPGFSNSCGNVFPK